MRFGRGLLLCVAVSLIGTVGRAGDPSPTSPGPDRAAALVRQLGDPSVWVRDKASEELVKLGRAAKAALLVGSRDSDPEIRTRSRQLLPAALWLDLQARIAAYEADADGKQEHDLPGLPRFRELFGTAPAARALFAEVLKSDAALVELAEADAKAVITRFSARAQFLHQQFYNHLGGSARRTLNKGDVACLLFVGAHPDLELPPAASYPVYTMLQQPPIRQLITEAKADDPFRKLVLAWVRRRTEPTSINQSLMLARDLNLTECLDLAVAVLRDRQAQAWNRAYAVTTVGKLGGKDVLKVLEETLADNTTVGNLVFNNVQGTTELRDVALAMCIHVTGQRLADYQFEVLGNNPSLLFQSPYYCGFSEPAKREAALKKWQAWKAGQSAAAKPAEPAPAPDVPKK